MTPKAIALLIAVFLTAFSVFARTVGAATDSALRIGSDKQLFIGPWTDDGRDEHLVESLRNVTMTANESRVTGERLVVIDKPWEENPFNMLDMRQCVIKDGDLFRMYYSALPKFPKLWEGANCRILCYAESRDGIHWEKPNLGLCTWQGSKDNNIILPHDGLDMAVAEMEGATVFIDPAAKSKDEKYKMFIKVKAAPEDASGDRWRPPKGQYAFVGADGIHWKLKSRKPVNPGASDTQFSVFHDGRIGQYVSYTRMKPHDAAQVEYYRRTLGITGRPTVLKVGRMTSPDFVNWSKETAVLEPDEIDRADSPPGLTRMDFYGGNVSKYTEAPNIYLALPNTYYHWTFHPTRRRPASGGEKAGRVQLPSTLDVQLATSRDGIHWNRTPGRKPFIRLGPEGSFWSKTLWPGADVIRVGDELWIFFAGLDVSHKEQDLFKSNGARSRAVLRLDGFISADAAYTGGELTTRPLVFDGAKLRLNVDTSAGGICQVEIQDESGKPISGFTLADADEINGNYIRVPASWRGNTNVSSLSGRPVKLRFVMRDTKLYSFQFLQKEDPPNLPPTEEK